MATRLFIASSILRTKSLNSTGVSPYVADDIPLAAAFNVDILNKR